VPASRFSSPSTGQSLCVRYSTLTNHKISYHPYPPLDGSSLPRYCRAWRPTRRVEWCALCRLYFVFFLLNSFLSLADSCPPQARTGQISEGESEFESDFADRSGPLFSMYLEQAEKEDNKVVERWRADAGVILVFVSPHIVSLLPGCAHRPEIVGGFVLFCRRTTGRRIHPRPQAKPAGYLQLLSRKYLRAACQSQRNSQMRPFPSLSGKPPSFSPPGSAIAVNSLWFLSLTLSLTCALLATLQQEWAYRYIRITQSRYGPHKRARIRSFFGQGLSKLRLPWVMDAVPIMLHLSLFLFVAGLVVFAWNMEQFTVYNAIFGGLWQLYNNIRTYTLMPLLSP
jgi:hypothetical protein